MMFRPLIPALLLCGLGAVACNSEPDSTTPDAAPTEGAETVAVETVSFEVSGLT